MMMRKEKTFFQAIEITNHPKMFLTGQARSLKWQWGLLLGGHSITTWTWFCPFLITYLPTSTWTFYTLNVDNKLVFFDHLPPSSCPHSFWTTPFPKILHAIRLPLFVHHHNTAQGNCVKFRYWHYMGHNLDCMYGAPRRIL